MGNPVPKIEVENIRESEIQVFANLIVRQKKVPTRGPGLGIIDAPAVKIALVLFLHLRLAGGTLSIIKTTRVHFRLKSTGQGEKNSVGFLLLSISPLYFLSKCSGPTEVNSDCLWRESKSYLPNNQISPCS